MHVTDNSRNVHGDAEPQKLGDTTTWFDGGDSSPVTESEIGCSY